jgi:hypothetical protein
MKPSFLAEKKSNIKLQTSSKLVNNERVKLNQTKAKNQKMRLEIDVLRKELSSAIGEVDRIKKGIKRAKKEAEN